MPPDDETDPVDLDVDPILMERVFLIGAILSFAVALLGLAGELLGWWNDTGELLISTGTLAGLTLTIGFGFANASRRQVTAVHGAVLDNGKTLASADRKLDQLDQLDKLDKLDVIERALVAQDGQTSRLDVVQVELDRQTHVLDRQVGLLTEIRDRL